MKVKEFLKVGLTALAITGGVLTVTYALYNVYDKNTEKNVIALIESKGFTDVEVTGSAVCRAGNVVRKKFEAINKSGRLVAGKICEGSSPQFSSLETKEIGHRKNKI